MQDKVIDVIQVKKRKFKTTGRVTYTPIGEYKKVWVVFITLFKIRTDNNCYRHNAQN